LQTFALQALGGPGGELVAASALIIGEALKGRERSSFAVAAIELGIELGRSASLKRFGCNLPAAGLRKRNDCLLAKCLPGNREIRRSRCRARAATKLKTARRHGLGSTFRTTAIRC
jgi:hypothetical protein